jgi:T5SS/PEP-CTERM-associated repeat protein
MRAKLSSRILPCFALALGLAFGPAAPAQLVSDGNLATINGIATNISPADLTVGTNLSNTRLVITNGGRVDNVAGYLGFNSGSSTNQLTVTGNGSVWNNSGSINIGNAGAFNSLLIAGGGTVVAAGAYVGRISTSTNNRITVAGGTLRATNASATAVLDIRRGTNAFTAGLIEADNLLLTNTAGSFEFNGGTLVTRSGTINNGQDFAVGQNVVPLVTTFANNSLITITDNSPAAVYPSVINVSNVVHPIFKVTVTLLGLTHTFTDDLDILLVGPGGQKVMLMSDAGQSGDLNNANLTFDDSAGVSLPNATQISPGTYVPTDYETAENMPGPAPASPYPTNLSTFNGVNANGSWLLYVRDDVSGDFGTMQGWSLQIATIVPAAWEVRSNAATIISGGLYIGSNAANATLHVAAGGAVQANSAYLGFNAASTNNRVTVDGGTLRATNVSGTGVLNINRGTNVLNAGLIETDQLLLTNTLGSFNFNGGTLNSRGATVANGTLFTVGNGSSAATYHLSGATTDTHSFANGLVVSGNASLTGNGLILNTVTVASGGTLSPGSSIGKISLNSQPVLQGRVVMEIGKNGSNLINDFIEVSGNLNYGGSLTVSNLGPNPLASGDSFKLFQSSSSYAGAFAQFLLPTLPAGLSWTNQLLVNGSITVVNKTAPNVTGLARAGTNLIMNVKGGSPGTAWYQLTATNVALPLSNWTTNGSGVFDWLGNVTITNGINSAEARRYFRIYTP